MTSTKYESEEYEHGCTSENYGPTPEEHGSSLEEFCENQSVTPKEFHIVLYSN